MKKLLSVLICAVLILISVMSVNASVVGEKLIYDVFDTHVEIVGLNTEDTKIVVPSEIEGKPVTKIGYRAFCGSYIREIVLPDTIEEIGAGAFLDCLFLEKVEIPFGVSEIKFQTFRGCTLLRDVSIPESVTKIDDEAFYACSSLRNLSELSKDLTVIGESAFLDCHSLENIYINEENSVFKSVGGVLYTNSGEELFLYPAGKKDKTFEIPSTVRVLKEDAFEFSLLEEIVIPATVEIIEKNCFHHCPNLKSVIFEDSEVTVEDCAFLECSSLKKVVIPSDKIVLKNNVFDMCDKATLYAPENSNAFEYGVNANLYKGYVNADGSLSRPIQMPKINWGKVGTVFGGIVLVVGGFFLYRKFGKDKKEVITRE